VLSPFFSFAFGRESHIHESQRAARLRRNIMASTKKPVTLKHMAAQMAADHEMTKVQSEAMLGDLVEIIAKHLKQGERIKLAGLGIFQVRHRAARMGRNPATGEPIAIKASKKVAFRASKDLKMAV
jgi:DNA-binding protein HU-beta